MRTKKKRNSPEAQRDFVRLLGLFSLYPSSTLARRNSQCWYLPLVVSAGHAGGCCQPGDEGGVGVADVNVQ